MDIIFLRHGKTEYNEKGIYGGSSDIPLSPAGRDEAKKASKLVNKREFSGVYVSPLKRAFQTAEELGVSGKSDERLREMNFGIFEGLSYAEILKMYPREMDNWTRDYINYRIPGGESLIDVYQRVSDFINEISREKGRILVVTHEGVIKCSLCSIFDNMEYYFKFKAVNCRFTQIAMEENYKYIKAVNSVEIY